MSAEKMQSIYARRLRADLLSERVYVPLGKGIAARQ